jgi:hypothetical protein
MEKISKEGSKFSVDKLGISLSGICAVHCFLTPVLLLLIPSWGSHFHQEEIHWFFFLFVAPVATYSFWRTYQAHKNIKPLILGCLGLIILSLPIFVEHFHNIGHVISLIGSALMILAHLQSLRCQCHHSH